MKSQRMGLISTLVTFLNVLLLAVPVLAQSRAPVGMNLEPHLANSAQIIFADAMKRATPWVSINFPYDGQWNTGVDVPLDPSTGYPVAIPYQPQGGGPSQIVGTFLFNDMEGKYPAGIYTLVYEGTGELSFSGATGDLTFDQEGTYTVNVDPTQGNVYFEIVSSDASDPIRDIRFILPNHDQTDTFYNPFLDRLRPFSSVRFMQTMQTNDGAYPCDNGVDASSATCVKQWANRPQANYYTQATNRGVALEYLIDLANATYANPWFTLPHGADDHYIQQFAQTVLQRLNPTLSVYIELSNELWNFSGAYPQSDWAQAAGLAALLDTDPSRAREKFVAKRSADMFHIFQTEFGTQHHRVINVLPGLVADHTLNRRMLEDLNDSNVNPHGVKAHALAIAAYIGGDVLDIAVFQGQADQLTPTDLIRQMQDTMINYTTDPRHPTELSPGLLTMLWRNHRVALSHEVDLIAYEGGQYLLENQGTNNHQALGQAAIAANRDGEMYHLYREMMHMWEGVGGLFMHYSMVRRPSWRWGIFGALEWADQPINEAHKYRALLHYVVGKPIIEP